MHGGRAEIKQVAGTAKSLHLKLQALRTDGWKEAFETLKPTPVICLQ